MKLLAAFGFILTTAYCSAISGGATTPRWLFLALTVPVTLCAMLTWLPPMKITLAHIVGFAFLAWAAISMSWSGAFLDSVDAIWKLALLGALFCLGAQVRSLVPFFVGAAVGIGLSSILVLIDAATGWRFASATPYAGLFINKNYLAESAALILVGIVAYRAEIGRYWIAVAPLTQAAIMFPMARGAYFALMVAGLWMAGLQVRREWHLAIIGLGLASGAVWLLPGLTNTASIQARLDIWHDAINGLTIFGHGIGAYGSTVQSVHVDSLLVRNEFAHNDLLQILYELGAPGLALACWFSWIILNSGKPERFVYAAFLIEGLFAFPLHLPVTAAIAALVAGHVAGDMSEFSWASFMGRNQLLEGNGSGEYR